MRYISYVPKVLAVSFSLFGFVNLQAAPDGITADGVTVDETNANVVTTLDNDYGTHALNGGIINFSGGSISTSGLSAHGAFAEASSEIHFTDNVAIVTTGSGADGLHAENGGVITMIGGDITTSGGSNNGVASSSVSNVQIDNTNINMSGSDIVGLRAEFGSTLSAINSNIVINASGGISNGASASLISNLILNNTTLTAINTVAGVQAAASSVNILNSTVNTQGANNPDVVINSNSSATINNSTIGSQGANSPGLTVNNNSNATVSNSTIETIGDFSNGAAVQNTSNLILNNSTITTAGQSSHGLSADGPPNIGGFTAQLNGTTINTVGANAVGLFLQNGSLTSLSDSAVATTGSNAYAVSFNGGSTFNRNLLFAENTQFSTANATLLNVAASAFALVNFTGVTANAALGQQFMNVGDLADLNLTVSNSTLSGNINNSGTTNLNFNNGTTYTGAIMTSGTTNFELAGASWNLNGNSNLNELLNGGNINFVANGTNFKRLTISDSYVSDSGLIGLNTYLGSDSTTMSDQIILDGATATGSTTLNFTNQGGGGALTSGNGVLVVNAINGGSTATNAFSQGNAVLVAGPYTYTLHRGGINNNNPENWYLRSITNISPVNPVTPSVPSSVINKISAALGLPAGFIPNFRPIVSLYSSIPSIGMLYNQMLLDTLHQRVGEETQVLHDGSLSHQPYMSGVWIRTIHNNGNRDNGTIFRNGPEFDYNNTTVQAGFDVYHRDYENGGADFAGLLGAGGQSNAKVKNIFSQPTGNVYYDNYTTGLYWTHYGRTGWYIDGVLTGTYSDITAVSFPGAALNEPDFFTHATNWGGSLEGGYPIYFGNHYSLELQGQLSHQQQFVNNSHGFNVVVHYDNTQSTVGRIGLRLDKTWLLGPTKIITGWLTTSVAHEFQGNSSTLFSSLDGFVPIGSTVKGDWVDVGVGVSARVTKNLSLYASADRKQLFSSSYKGYANEGRIGMRVNI